MDEIKRLAAELYDIQQKFEYARMRPKTFNYDADKAAFIEFECLTAEMHKADAALREAQAKYAREAEKSRLAGNE